MLFYAKEYFLALKWREKKKKIKNQSMKFNKSIQKGEEIYTMSRSMQIKPMNKQVQHYMHCEKCFVFIGVFNHYREKEEKYIMLEGQLTYGKVNVKKNRMMINCGKCKEEVGEIKSQEFYFGKNLVKKTTITFQKTQPQKQLQVSHKSLLTQTFYTEQSFLNLKLTLERELLTICQELENKLKRIDLSSMQQELKDLQNFINFYEKYLKVFQKI